MKRWLGLALGLAALGAVFSACAVGAQIYDENDSGIPPGGDGARPDACASCVPGELCSQGQCVKGCLATETKCGTSCTDIKTDGKNCGGCNKACPMGYDCTAGKCALACPMGQSACDSTDDAGADAGPKCVDTKKDGQNCGSCGNVCTQTVDHGLPGCVSGTCGIGSCDMGWDDCDKMAMNGCEAELAVDKSNCGKCGVVCSVQTPVCAQGICKQTSCGNNVIDNGERCDGTTGIVQGGKMACYPSGNKLECKWDFSQVSQLYCNGSCSWAGGNGCDLADADIFCKLKTGNPNSTAASFTTTTALAQEGFPCQPFGNYGTALGAIPEYGVNLANNGGVRYQPTSILANHGAGTVINSVVCK